MKNTISGHRNHMSPRQGGFTLAEVAVVIVIAGVLLATFAGSLSMYINKAENSAVKTNMDTIQAALEEFYAGSGRFPCPASRTAPPDTAAFGVEVGAGCVGGGVVIVNGIAIGALPVRALNLPDQYASDSWGNRYKYAVTVTQATSPVPGPGYANGNGRIAIVDSTNNNILSLPGTADYVVVSHGQDGAGATSNQGAAGTACPAAGAQRENCDDATTALGAACVAAPCVGFRKTTLTSTGPAANYFDDYVIFRAGSIGATSIQAVPSGAVMAFNLPACPTGWSPYVPAVGRMVVGVGNLNETYTPGDRPNWSVNINYGPAGSSGGFATYPLITTEMPAHTHNLDIGGGPATIVNNAGVTPTSISRGSVAGGAPILTTAAGGVNVAIPNVPPYVALLYCQKDP